MSEISDWKLKYRDAIQEMEREEKRCRQIEQALRQLIGRLCAAGMGVNPQLDDQLVAVAAANRRNADAMELARMAASLTTAVAAVDAVSPVPGVNTTLIVALPWNSTRGAAGTLVQNLGGLVGAKDEVLLALVEELTRAHSDAALAAVLGKAADLIQGHGETLVRERRQAAAVLGGVTRRLEEVAGYLTESGDDARSRFADTASVNDTVILQVRELTAEVNGATELNALQAMVNTRLESVTRQVLDFRAREESRLLEQTGRADIMRSRIADLERETQDLHSKLDRERHGARLDSLTRLANRKSFDERFAQEMQRLSHGDPPAALLLWDLDNFKTINDTYGHRAGDRVLQSVAGCFLSRLGAEHFVARIGGEEFVVLLTGMAFSRASMIADELRRSVEMLRFHFRGTPVRVTVSCGLTELRAGDAGGAAFDRADGALYQAKQSGKNACVAA